MSYSDCDRSKDIDNLESKTRDLESDIYQIKRDLQTSISHLESQVGRLHERIAILEQNAANDVSVSEAVSEAVRQALEYHYIQEHGEKSIIAMLQTEYYKEKR